MIFSAYDSIILDKIRPNWPKEVKIIQKQPFYDKSKNNLGSFLSVLGDLIFLGFIAPSMCDLHTKKSCSIQGIDTTCIIKFLRVLYPHFAVFSVCTVTGERYQLPLLIQIYGDSTLLGSSHAMRQVSQ